MTYSKKSRVSPLKGKRKNADALLDQLELENFRQAIKKKYAKQKEEFKE